MPLLFLESKVFLHQKPTGFHRNSGVQQYGYAISLQNDVRLNFILTRRSQTVLDQGILLIRRRLHTVHKNMHNLALPRRSTAHFQTSDIQKHHRSAASRPRSAKYQVDAPCACPAKGRRQGGIVKWACLWLEMSVHDGEKVPVLQCVLLHMAKHLVGNPAG